MSFIAKFREILEHLHYPTKHNLTDYQNCRKTPLFGNYFVLAIRENTSMIVRKIMADLLFYTKKIAQKISYYDAIIDFTDESHWFNPFYKQPDVTVIWIDTPEKINDDKII